MSKNAASAARAAQALAALEEREREILLRASGQAADGGDRPERNNFSCSRCRKVCSIALYLKLKPTD